MTNDPMKARAREFYQPMFYGTQQYVPDGNVIHVTLGEVRTLMADFATKERSDARREGMEAAAKIAEKGAHIVRDDNGKKACLSVATAIRAQIAEEAKNG